MITIELFEGENSFINIMCRNLRANRICVCSLTSAQTTIDKAALFAPKAGFGYDKVCFVVTISEIEATEYSFTFTGRLDIQQNRENDLFAHIDNFVTNVLKLPGTLPVERLEALADFRNRLHAYRVFDDIRVTL